MPRLTAYLAAALCPAALALIGFAGCAPEAPKAPPDMGTASTSDTSPPPVDLGDPAGDPTTSPAPTAPTEPTSPIEPTSTPEANPTPDPAGEAKPEGEAKPAAESKPEGEAKPATPGEPELKAADGSSDAAKIELKTIEPAQLAAELAKHKGKVVLVDFWATWCGPCVTQLPHSVHLAKSLGEKGLVVITVSMDSPDSRADVEKKLAELAATSTINLVDANPEADGRFDAYEIDNGAIPHYRLYDRTGKLAHKFVSGDPDQVFEPKDIDAKVEELLAAPVS